MTRAVTFADLDSQHASFLEHFFTLGARPEDGPEAAKRAGLAKGDEDAKRAAAILLGSDKITRAIKAEVQKRFHRATGEALDAILDVCRNGRNEASRLAAAREILGQAGLVIVSRSASVNASVSIEDILEQIDAAKAPPATAKIIDVKSAPVTDK